MGDIWKFAWIKMYAFVYIVSWEPERRYCSSKMFCWETRRAPLLYKVNGNSALLILNGTSLICNTALLALNWRYTGTHWWSPKLGYKQCLTTFYLQLDTIQGGPERMQQLWLLISWTSSMKHNFFNILFGRTFIFQQNDTIIISFG